MSNNSPMQGLKEVCNLIVGNWHNEKTGVELIFSLNDKLLRESKLIILYPDEKPKETEYGIFERLKSDGSGSIFAFDTGKFEKQYYDIISITKEKLVVREFYM